MAEVNIIKTPDMGEVNALDLVNRFSFAVKGLQKILGISNLMALKQGNSVALYKFVVTKPNDGANWGVVAEGDDIPLTHVKREKVEDLNIAFKKYRKAVTIEEVQRVGYEMASNNSDKAILREAQKDIRAGFINALITAPVEDNATNLQQAIAKIWGQTQAKFDDEDIEVVAFVNPLDAADYLGGAQIENGQSVGFGLTLLGGFTNAMVFTTNAVAKGTVVGTAKTNLNIAYIDGKGETARMFGGKTVFQDDTGLISYVKSDNTVNATEEALIYTGVAVYPEMVDGVVKVTLAEEPSA